MTIQLRLDTQALNALFPEGSQARVELQAAVIAEFVRKQLKPNVLGSDVARQIESARADALRAIKTAKDDMMNKILADQGVVKSGWGNIELKNEAKATINEAARKAVRDEIANTIREQIDAQAENLRGVISHDAQAAVNRLVDAEIKAAVKARVQEVAKGVLGGT